MRLKGDTALPISVVTTLAQEYILIIPPTIQILELGVLMYSV